MNIQRIVPALCLFLMVIAVTGHPLFGLQSAVLEKDITVPAGETQRNVVTLGGRVVVEGKVTQNIVAIGGTVIVNGEVGEAVVGIGTVITLKSGAAVHGDVIAIGGILDKEPGCSISGDTVYFRADQIKSEIFKNGVFHGFLSLSLLPFILVIKLIFAFIWLALALIVAGLFPRQISLASDQIRHSFWPVFGTGILAMIAFGALVLFSILLSLIIIGIPILLSLFLLGFVIKVFGRVVLFYFFGQSLLKAFRARTITPMGAVLTGLLFVSAAGLVPVFGFLFAFVLTIIGWGAVIRTKFGTKKTGS
ncbi:MAG TPA: polymer-forming cytoskeletal protein [Candidatus Aminicenantes bacterium]|nr:polymer-forming cytoskeletal protein [Candidatus Aminicenantes bacterium]